MSYRGPAVCYQIRKTTIGNATGDSFAVTIPRVIAQNFEGIFFKIVVSGTNIILTSGCNIKIDDETKSKEGIVVNFR